MKALAADDPREIGGYRLRARLGSGGMGRVYLGFSPGGRAVAVKVVHPGLARDAEFLRRFAQEVAAARAVSGIYTAPVVASGLDEHPPWLATAFVPGPSLEQVVSEHGPLPEAALWPLLAGLVEALQAVHASQVVHRDLKPPNVLLATDGPRVIDFGISRAADGTALTAAGEVFGTPGYMSPEQAEGRTTGPASDVFALGCVLGYAGTGAGPFGSGTAAAVLYRVVHAEPALAGLSPRLREIVAACLAKDPAARPPLAALARTIASGVNTTGPSAMAFWPPQVAGVIGAYQATLEQQTGAVGTRELPPSRPYTSAQGYPEPQTYAQPQTYPQPQRYEGAQASPPPPPRGYLPAGSAGGAGAVAYPQSYRPGSRGPLTVLPGSMVVAVRLMYAGAAFALIYGIGFVLVASSYLKHHPAVTAGRPGLGAVVVLAGLGSLADIALWLWIARACTRGRNWARVTGTVLFCIDTLGALAVLGNGRPGIGPDKLLTLISWLIACAAVVFLWRRPSSLFFRAAASPGR